MTARFAALMMTLFQAFLVAQHSGDYQFALAASLLAAVGCFVWPKFKLPAWLHGLLIGLTTFGCFFANIVYPPEIDPDWLLPGRYIIALAQTLIIAQLFEFWFGHNTDPQSVRYSGLALGGFLICFCRAEQPDIAPMFFWLAIGMVVAVLALGQMVDPMSPGRTTRAHFRSGNQLFRWGLLLLASLAITAGTGLAADAAKRTLGLSRYFITNRTVEAIQSQVSRVAYAASGDLFAIARLKQTAPNQQALAVTCDVLPGYLRGRVFSDLTLGGWREKLTSATRTRWVSRFSGNRPERSFVSDRADVYGLFEVADPGQVKELGPNLRSIQLQNSTEHLGEVFFAPLNSFYFEGAGNQVKLDPHDVVRGGISSNRPYYAYVMRRPAAIELDSEQTQKLLQVPSAIRQRLESVASQICATGSSDLQKMGLVESWFRNNYRYSLEPFSANSFDRISWFVLNRPPAHCEYFASAAAVCLRLNGIPARYVTGFGVDTPSESDQNSGEMWVARNRDAHAWVEAYDRQQKKWVVVEATPGVDLPKDLWSDGGAGLATGSSFGNLQTTQSESFGQWLGRHWNWLVTTVTDSRTALNWSTIGLCVYMLVVFYRRRPSTAQVRHYQRMDLASDLLKLDRRLKKLKLVRGPAETLHQFSDRLLEYTGDESTTVHAAADRYRQYALVRYLSSSKNGRFTSPRQNGEIVGHSHGDLQ